MFLIVNTYSFDLLEEPDDLNNKPQSNNKQTDCQKLINGKLNKSTHTKFHNHLTGNANNNDAPNKETPKTTKPLTITKRNDKKPTINFDMLF